MSSLSIKEVTSPADRHAVATLPWRVYRGDKNWVPPIIKDREKQLDPARNRFFQQADVVTLLASREGQPVGSIVAFVDRRFNQYLNLKAGLFGFFEVLEDYAAAEALLGAAAEWLRNHGMNEMRGPINFHRDRERGILVWGADCPPPMLCAHSPPYYKEFAERFGLVKYSDDFCRRVFMSSILTPDGQLPERLARLQKVAERRGHFSIRRAREADFDEEVRRVGELYDATIGKIPDHVPWTREELETFARELRPVMDPAFALFGEISGKVIGCALAFPDINQALIHLNGSLDGLNKLRAWWYMKRINVLSFKMAGVIEQYQGLGLEALFFLEMAKAALPKHYEWVDLSLQAEDNDKVTQLVQHFKVEDYKRYRVYKMQL